MTVGLIVACDPLGVIGIDNKIPWRYPSDLRRFRELTMGGTLIMGRRTFESMGRRHLPGRTTLVLSDELQPDAPTFSSVEAAISQAMILGHPIWIIGGAQVYRYVLEKGLADFVDLTLVPPVALPEGEHEVATFPMSLLSGLRLVSTPSNPDDPLEHRRYERPDV